MNSILISVLSIYLFIAVGYIAKRTFKEQIDDRTITLLSVYFLQIFLTFWGLLKRPIDTTLVYAPALYFVVVMIALAFSIIMARVLFKDTKERSIATVAALIGNTGNLGIPLGIAIFGEESIPYTTIINLVNVFFVYIVGVYFYSRGSFSMRTSLVNILKIPIIWAAFIAIALNLYGYHPSEVVDKGLQMGAYASMVMQLLLFGIYLYDIKITTINRMLIGWVSSVKFILLPLITFAILSQIEMDSMIKGILFMELIMPLAVANVNLGSLYDCRPKDITALVFLTSVMFLGVVFIAVEVIKWL
ncbi:MAG: AEC family transporter [Helicobacteraceae bacterium]|jgi:predicted permease|nr:AEC family transporter [Helicobacteraceae bacterium]